MAVRSADETFSKLTLIDGKDAIAPSLEVECLVDCTRNTESAPSCNAEDTCFNQDSGYEGSIQLFGFEPGVHYPLIEGRLYFSCHPDDEFTLAAIQRDKSLFYFSSNVPGTP